MTDMEREAKRLQELEARNRRLEIIFTMQAVAVQIKLERERREVQA
jgi:hypothetical protein